MRVEHKWIIGYDEMPQDEIDELIKSAREEGCCVYITTTNVCVVEEKYFDLRGVGCRENIDR